MRQNDKKNNVPFISLELVQWIEDLVVEPPIDPMGMSVDSLIMEVSQQSGMRKAAQLVRNQYEKQEKDNKQRTKR